MTGWASNWKDRTLDSMGIEITPDSMKVITAWRKSTPLDPWTNNPLGMPAVTGRVQAVPGTQYAMYPTITAFYAAIAMFAKTPVGHDIVNVINANQGYGPMWRAISATGWPATKTEEDWPYHVLALAGQAYLDSLGVLSGGKRKSAGTPQASPAIHETMRRQAESVTHAAASFTDSLTAVRFLIRRHARYGN